MPTDQEQALRAAGWKDKLAGPAGRKTVRWTNPAVPEYTIAQLPGKDVFYVVSSSGATVGARNREGATAEWAMKTAEQWQKDDPTGQMLDQGSRDALDATRKSSAAKASKLGPKPAWMDQEDYDFAASDEHLSSMRGSHASGTAAFYFAGWLKKRGYKLDAAKKVDLGSMFHVDPLQFSISGGWVHGWPKPEKRVAREAVRSSVQAAIRQVADGL
jgi:hypothetical protein